MAQATMLESGEVPSLSRENPHRLLRERLTENGFVASGLRLDQQAIASLRGALGDFLSRAQPGRYGNQIVARFGDDLSNQGWKVNNLWETCPDFRALASHPGILGEVAALTGARSIRLWRDQLLLKQPGFGSDVKWHQDAYWWSVLAPASQVTAWIALDDVSVQNGCMRMVAASHKAGLQTQLIDEINGGSAMVCGNGDALQVVNIELPAGGIHYHHCLTWHSSYPNTSASSRIAYAIHYLIDDTYRVLGNAHPIADALTVDEQGRVSGDNFPLLWSRSRR